MKRVTIPTNRTIANSLLSIVVLIAMVMLSSCEKALDIRTNFPFEVEVLPVPKRIAPCQSVEIRCEIKPEQVVKDTQYFIRYFQYEGSGKLHIQGNNTPLLFNDLYLLPDRTFRLYYTALAGSSHELHLWIVDSNGNQQQLGFVFRNDEN